MHYVGNNHVAFDNVSLGFPSILGCQAIVYQTNDGLFGFHDMKSVGGAEVDAAKSAAFAEWVGQQYFGDSAALNLYGVINQSHQYSTTTEGEQDWAGMLLGVAEALNFDGPVYGARITSHVKKRDSLYVRFEVEGGGCKIEYKRWSKMELDMTTVLKPADQALIRRESSSVSAVHVFRTETLSTSEYQESYPVVRQGQTDEGGLNRVANKKIVQFR